MRDTIIRAGELDAWRHAFAPPSIVRGAIEAERERAAFAELARAGQELVITFKAMAEPWLKTMRRLASTIAYAGRQERRHPSPHRVTMRRLHTTYPNRWRKP